jgi:SAM-dependent methyltransferase
MNERSPARVRRGSSPRERAQWQKTYERTPYEQLPWFEPGPSPGVKLAVDEGFLPEGAAVLDIGCGAGSNVLFLAERGRVAHGIDLSPGAVAAARSRAARAGFTVDIEEGDALALRFADASLDAVIDNGCFHTLPFSRRGRYAKEVHRVLCPEGRFVLSWVAREHTAATGPPHRPSLGEVTAVFESRFLFVRTGFRPAPEEGEPSTYFAFLARRTDPHPPRR